MAQNLISLALADADLAAIDGALATLEEKFANLIPLNPDEIRALAKIGDKSEAFCRQALVVLDQNRQVVPPSLDLNEALTDLRTIDALRPRLARLERLSKRADDTLIALGSDVLTAALEGYALLRISGKGQGLESLQQGLSTRFAKNRRVTAEPEPEAETET